MAEPTGPNNRVIEVINFLAAHPTEAFTLSELAKHLELSNGSAHRVLSTLTEARYLSRHPKHKTYSLGVALVAIGHAALEKHRGIDIARREMARLTNDLNVQCVATAIVDGEILFLAKEGSPRGYERLNRVGERLPFLPPLGLGHVTWADPSTRQAYLDKAQQMLTSELLGYLHDALAKVRERGYSIACNGDAIRALHQTATVSNHRDTDTTYWEQVRGLLSRLTKNEILLLDIADAGDAGVGYISAPVFAPDGSVAMEISVSGMPDKLPLAEIEQIAQRVRGVAAIITSETHGRAPALAG